MRLKINRFLLLCGLALSACMSATQGVVAQEDDPATAQQRRIGEDDVCADLFFFIEQEYVQGHILVMDSLIREYEHSGCYSIDARHTIDVLRMVKKMRLEDNYRIKEADSLEKVIQEKTLELHKGVKYNGRIFKAGLGVTYDYPFAIDFLDREDAKKFGSFSWHATAGYRFNIRRVEHNVTYWGVDVEYCYQKVAFSFKAINNKDENNLDLPDGFILKTNGYNEFHKLGLLISRNREPVHSGLGYGAFIGAEVFQLWDTRVHKYYYEYGYSDSVVHLDGEGSSRVISSFNSFSRTQYDNSNFFSSEILVNIPAGLNLHAKAGSRLLATLSAYASVPLSELKLSGIDYSRDIGYFGMKFTVSYLFMRKELFIRKYVK